MTYDETVDYLFNCAPPFQQVGGAAYKEGLTNTIAIDNHLGNPHHKFRTIHVAGTNGKGSSSHTLAAILQAAGYKVGLYTSPHLIDFRERIRVNGTPASKQFVIDFVERERAFFEPLSPSFFELTTAMAFTYFAQEQVDVAIIEVGLGGRLDCTNIIAPDLCIITNISLDHTQFLGSTPTAIAAEKAGIIKPGIPVIIGEATPETRKIFTEKAAGEGAPIVFAQDEDTLISANPTQEGIEYTTADYGIINGELAGEYQIKNTRTILTALRELLKKGYKITADNVREGFANVCSLTGFMGRWQKIGDNPLTVCDAGHNIGGIEYVTHQLARQECDTLRIVFGMVSDKDITAVLSMMPRNAVYYFTQASIKRAMPAEELCRKAAEHGLRGNSYPTVGTALEATRKEAAEKDFIFIGGSCFIVADLLAHITAQKENNA
ncbi:MAG: bifunctional folylpolyglutamate synthase/dihydrofolate synthase [Bacteroidaceae bacterium]|nr:bifunctional folylpolyglutamate synthase/dihydrofolate synthase [Bacteroidaceae bacterium]